MGQVLSHKGESGSAASPLWHTVRRRLPWLDKDTATAILMLIPSIIAVAVFIYGFIGWTGYVSMVKWDSPIEDYTFVGLRNWINLFKMDRFHWNLRNLALYALGFMSQCILFGFLIAVLLDQNIKGEAVFRTIVIFPFAVSAIVTGVAWRWLMQPSTGINLLLEKLGLVEDMTFAWNAHPRWGILSIAIASSWQFTGYIMALYLAGLRGVSDELRDAARVDGAGTWALYRRIIIPLLRPVTFSAFVLTGMNAIRVYDLITILGGPAFTTDTLGFHMYQSTFGLYRFSMGATIGFFMILLSAFLVGPYLRSMEFEEGR